MICAADNECLIDRYDGRALLDKIPKKSTIKQNFKSSKEENLLNYERYKPLIEFFKKNSMKINIFEILIVNIMLFFTSK